MSNNLPKTLMEAIKHFSDEMVCIEFVASLRWVDGIATCPRCESTENYFLKTRKVWKCKSCKKQFSVKVGTIFEASPIGLDKWLMAIWMIANCKNGVSSYEIHREIGLTQKSAWFLLHRIRKAMQNGSFEKLSGEVEADETFVGGLAKNMSKARRERRIKGRGSVGKTAVLGILQREGNVKAKVISDTTKATLHREVLGTVENGSKLYTDEWRSYRGLGIQYQHEVINHSISEYVRGAVHTNSIENYWSLLKRTIRGTYVSVEPFHLDSYLDEQSFRFNERKTDSQTRFSKVVSGVSGRKITYAELIGECQI
jgi:transposase-like protein